MSVAMMPPRVESGTPVKKSKPMACSRSTNCFAGMAILEGWDYIGRRHGITRHRTPISRYCRHAAADGLLRRCSMRPHSEDRERPPHVSYLTNPPFLDPFRHRLGPRILAD